MISSNELMAMFPELGFEMECEFVIDDDSFAIAMRGHYTPAELRMMCAQCEHANTVFARCPRTKEARDALIHSVARAAELLALLGDIDRNGFIGHINYATDEVEINVRRSTSKGQSYWVTVGVKNDDEFAAFYESERG